MASSGRMRPTRYAHFEGHTDLCYSDDGRYIITCGTDGEVRVFEGLDDDDCKTHVVAECAHAVAYRNERFLVATDSSMVNAFTLEDGSPDGIVTRFTAPATHIVVGGGGKVVVCGGSDMTIRVHDPIAYKDMEFLGHEAPVLSVAVDPQTQYIASSSCDGTIKLWHRDSGKIRVSWDLLPHTNSVANSPTLCRLAFTPAGDLAVPVGPKVLLYERGDWGLVGELGSERVKETISIIAVSPDGRFLAGGCIDGTLGVWHLTTRHLLFTERHPKGHAYSGLAWHPGGKREVAFVDVNGQLGVVMVDEVDAAGGGLGADTTPQLGLQNGTDDPPFPPLDDNAPEDDDEAEISLSKIKADLGFADDEEGTFLGLSSVAVDDDSKDAKPEQGGAPGPERSAPPPREVGAGLPAVQRPFQPGMSPEHLTERYMLWNNVGIVRQYSGDEESSIDVEFHDSSVHHSLHINNSANHSMAALSTQVLALAAESTEGQPSKVVTQQLSGGKEWHCDMPEGEDILALAVGTDWLAVATDLRNLRIFGTCGTQRHVMALPGPVVCLAGHEKSLMVVFHSGVGVSGDQSMSAIVLNLGGKKHPVPQASPVALSPRAFLAWAGFSDEGSPVTMDSMGQVRLLNRALGNAWTTVLDTRKHVKGKSDHYFLVGLNEAQSSVRCVLCRGARYPPTLPRPYLSLLTMQIPLCELDTEKGTLEEQMMRAALTCSRLTHPRPPPHTPVTPEEEQNQRVLQEAMIKLFALAVGASRECRAMEVCRLMPKVDTVQHAIRYAAKKQRMALAERLGQLAAQMVEEQQEEEEEEEEEEEWRFTQRRRRGGGRGRREEEEEEEEEEVQITQEEEEEEEEEEEKEEPKQTNPLLEASRRLLHPSSAPSLLSNKNPFKKSLSSSGVSSGGGLAGLQALDSLRKMEKKDASSSVLRPVVRKSQKKKPSVAPQTPVAPGKENHLGGPQTQTPNPFKKTPAPSPKPRAPLHIWMDDNMELLKATYPEAQEKELLVKAAMMFKDLDAETKQRYKAMADTPTLTPATPTPTPATPATPADTPTPTEDRKRPLEEEEEEEAKKKKKKGGSGLSKLSAFVFAAKE